MNHQWKARLFQSPVIWFKESCLSDEDEKALGPSGIVVEIIRAAGDTGASMICDHADAIISDGRVLSDTEQFHCLPLQG